MYCVVGLIVSYVVSMILLRRADWCIVCCGLVGMIPDCVFCRSDFIAVHDAFYDGYDREPLMECVLLADVEPLLLTSVERAAARAKYYQRLKQRKEETER